MIGNEVEILGNFVLILLKPPRIKVFRIKIAQKKPIMKK